LRTSTPSASARTLAGSGSAPRAPISSPSSPSPPGRGAEVHSGGDAASSKATAVITPSSATGGDPGRPAHPSRPESPAGRRCPRRCPPTLPRRLFSGLKGPSPWIPCRAVPATPTRCAARPRRRPRPCLRRSRAAHCAPRLSSCLQVSTPLPTGVDSSRRSGSARGDRVAHVVEVRGPAPDHHAEGTTASCWRASSWQTTGSSSSGNPHHGGRGVPGWRPRERALQQHLGDLRMPLGGRDTQPETAPSAHRRPPAAFPLTPAPARFHTATFRISRGDAEQDPQGGLSTGAPVVQPLHRVQVRQIVAHPVPLGAQVMQVLPGRPDGQGPRSTTRSP